MFIENENTFRASLRQGINLFLGAGFSVLAKDKTGRNLPIGRDLKDELITYFKVPNLSSLDLPKLSSVLEHNNRTEFQSFLRKRYTVQDFDRRYDVLPELNIISIFTTNIDDLLYKIYARSNRSYLNDLDLRGASFNDRLAIDMVALHGTVIDPKRNFTFTTRDISSAFHSDTDRWNVLTNRLQKHATLFWGYAVEDASVLEALDPKTFHGRTVQDRWRVFYEQPDDATSQYFQSLGFQIIVATTKELLDYLSKFFADISGSLPRVGVRPTENLFPDETIPKLGTVPVRPIIDFFHGAPPSWNDIFAGRLHRTRYFNEIRESINSSMHTIVLGLPASGKTTLMMQVAQDLTTSAHKLVCNSLTPEKASLISKTLKGESAVVFVDNFTDSIDGFSNLLPNKNVKLVGFDRIYNYEFVSHKIDKRLFNIIEVTSLDEHDIQEILTRIPENLRKSRRVTPVVGNNMEPSIFEILYANLIAPPLRDRYADAMEKMSHRRDELLQLLLLCCYVHRCRTLVSIDMLMAYFYDSSMGHEGIQKLIHQLGALISEAQSLDLEQDYFSPRSTIISEVIIDNAPAGQLGKMIKKFHRHISPYRIHRFDIFRRSAFDANLMSHAFPRWNDGVEFYTYVSNRDDSPFLKQQGAIYLAHKKRFDDAFIWIDDALTQSGGRNFSIRNSHAVILFKANIEKSESDGIVKKTLQNSMNILAECYNDDKRKSYHAITFADQAIRYYSKYADAAALAYISTALKWLEEEQLQSPWNKSIDRLLKQLRHVR